MTTPILVTSKEFMQRATALNANKQAIFEIIDRMLQETIYPEDFGKDVIDYPGNNNELRNKEFYLLCSPTDLTFSIFDKNKGEELSFVSNYKTDFITPLFSIIKEIGN